MFTIRCEQFKLGREENAPAERTIIYVMNFTPIPVAQPGGGPGMLQIGSMMVELVLDEAERAELHALTAPVETAETLAVLGVDLPEGAAVVRCGRLQPHPSHLWLQAGGENGADLERVEDLVWCDGQPAHAPFGEPTNDLPPATSQVDPSEPFAEVGGHGPEPIGNDALVDGAVSDD